MKSLLLCAFILVHTITLRAQEISFENVANELGISFSRDGGIFGGGLSYCDFDGDGSHKACITIFKIPVIIKK